jgi:hypothetical protein
LLTKHGARQTDLRRGPKLFGILRWLGIPVMDRRSSEKSKFAMAIIATTAAVLLWGFGAEFVLKNYVFVSPPVHSVQKVN